MHLRNHYFWGRNMKHEQIKMHLIPSVSTSLSAINDQPDQLKDAQKPRPACRFWSHALGGPGSAGNTFMDRMVYVCTCTYTVDVRSHTPAFSAGQVWTLVVAAKPWHSPSDMFKSVLITDSLLNLHLITSVCHIKKSREECHSVSSESLMPRVKIKAF